MVLHLSMLLACYTIEIKEEKDKTKKGNIRKEINELKLEKKVKDKHEEKVKIQ